MSFTQLNRLKVIKACETTTAFILKERDKILDSYINNLVKTQDKNSGFPFYKTLEQKTYEDFKKEVLSTDIFNPHFDIKCRYEYKYNKQLLVVSKLLGLAKISDAEYINVSADDFFYIEYNFPTE